MESDHGFDWHGSNDSSARSHCATSDPLRAEPPGVSDAEPALRTPKGGEGVSALFPGDRGPYIEQVQRALRSRGFDPGALDGVFGRCMLAAVRRLQRSAGLDADGVIRAPTLALLGMRNPWISRSASAPRHDR